MNPHVPSDLLSDLPGAERIREGLRDLHENRHSMSACLVRMARPRLAKAGLTPPPEVEETSAEIDLYNLLSHEGNRAHSRYNALVRELISFEHALDHRLRLLPLQR